MTCYDITTQAEYDARKDEPGAHFHVKGDAYIRMHGSSRAALHGSSRADLYDSSSAALHGSSRADLYDSSRAALYDSSRADLYGSSSAALYDSSSADLYGSSSAALYDSSRADLYDSSSADLYGSSSADLYDSSSADLYGSSRADLHGSSSADLYDSSSAAAGKYAAIHKHPGHSGTISGGVVIEVPDMNKATPAEWLDFWGLKPAGGKAVVYKAVDSDLNSSHGMAYPIGETVTAPDWEDTRECGQGLHFGPTPRHARRYAGGGELRFLACEVDAAQLVPLGDKVKAQSCRVLFEVDVNGRQVEAAEVGRS